MMDILSAEPTEYLYKIDGVPTVQNRVYETAAQAINCQRGDIRLSHHPDTGIVTNLAFDEKLVCYDRSYNNEQSLSAAFQQHLIEVAATIRRGLGTTNLFEVGCGKGAFLERLREDGCEIGGCDPTYEGTNANVHRSFFNESLGVSGKNLILRHVLEHVANPLGFLQLLAETNHGGKIYIEVPCLDWIIAKGTWFDIFYEHVNYFRQDDFLRIFRHVEVTKLFGGQYLGVVADLRNLQTAEKIKTLSSRSCEVKFPSEFCSPDIRNATANDVIWGAASKGVIYAIVREKLGVPLASAVDINPAKQGRHLPVTGIPVISPAEFMRQATAKKQVVVMNSNYLNEIRTLTENRFTYRTLETTN